MSLGHPSNIWRVWLKRYCPKCKRRIGIGIMGLWYCAYHCDYYFNEEVLKKRELK